MDYDPTNQSVSSHGPEPLLLKESCSLHGLTAAQQAQLFDWLELHPAKQVLDMIAAEPPEGFGIKTHLTTLRRFHLRARSHFHSQLAADPQLALERNAVIMHQEQLSLHALRQAAVEFSTSQHRSASQFNALAQWIIRLKEIDQREREIELSNKRIVLERDKFEYNAARATLIHQNQLKEILQNNTTDDEDKVWAAREKIFGPRSNLIEPKP